MGKKILSYALWGKEELYIRGAFENIRNRDTFFPDWICRFYIGEETMDPETITKLKEAPGVEIIEKGAPVDVLGMFWRFEAMYDDPEVERLLSRDTDCQFTWREVDAVKAWERSGKPFHVIRDNRQHNIPILGGTWGAVRNAVPDMKYLMEQFLQTPPVTTSQHPNRKHHGVDQMFLVERVWPLVRSNHLAHIRGGIPELRSTEQDIELPYLPEDGHFVGQPCVDLLPEERERKEEKWFWDSIALFLPTYKRPDNIARFVKTAHDTASNPSRLRLALCVNEKDIATREFLEKDFECPLAYEVILEQTRQPNLSKYFNILYDQTSFNSERTVVTMLGDDMYFQTSGWDEAVLERINAKNGNAIVFCNDGGIAQDELAVNLFTTRKIIEATEKPFMCPEFHAEMIDVVWTVAGVQASILEYLGDVVIVHDHGCVDGKKQDETYVRLQPLRQVTNNNPRNLKYARTYGTLCAANIIKKGYGEWNSEALVGRLT
jgi:hypothetical protein